MSVRKKTVRRVPRVHAAVSTYIDPLGCDSTVSYKVVSHRYLSGSVQLSDCSRKIEWYFSGDKSSLTKIDKAIEALQAFRAEFATALSAMKPVRKKRL